VREEEEYEKAIHVLFARGSANFARSLGSGETSSFSLVRSGETRVVSSGSANFASCSRKRRNEFLYSSEKRREIL
jgi:hypothetical protein